jgi:hypothetical protein
MRNRFYRFMYGRNGSDALARLFTIIALIFIVLSIIFSRIYAPVGTLLWIVAIISLIYSYVRVFSKKLDKRRAENAKYLAWKNRLHTRRTQSRNYKFFHCPQCKASMRVPRGKGKIRVTCHKCGNVFITKS